MDARPWDEGTAVRGRAVCYFLIPVYVCTACVPGLHGAAVADIQPQEPQEPQEPTSPRRQHREIWVRPCSPDIAWPWCSALLCSALSAQFHAMPSALAGHRQAQKYSPSPSPEQCGRWSRAEATGGGPQATGHRRQATGHRPQATGGPGRGQEAIVRSLSCPTRKRLQKNPRGCKNPIKHLRICTPLQQHHENKNSLRTGDPANSGLSRMQLKITRGQRRAWHKPSRSLFRGHLLEEVREPDLASF